MRQRVLLAAYTLLGLASSGCLNGVPDTRKDSRVAAGPSPTAASPATTEGEQQTRAQKPDSPGDPQAPPAPSEDVSTALERDKIRPRAVVGNVPILNDEVKFEMVHPGYRPSNPFTQRPTEREALDALIEREILMQHIEGFLKQGPGGEKFLEKLRKEANDQFEKIYIFPLMKRENLTTEEEFNEFVRAHQHDFPLELLRRQYVCGVIVAQYLGSVVAPHYSTIDRRMIQEYYDGHPEAFRIPDSVDWEVLFLYRDGKYANREAASNHAQVVAQRVRDGEDFSTLVEQLDYGLYKGTKGKGVGHHRGEIQPRLLEKDLFEMRENEVRAISTPTGHYVVRLVKRVKAGRMPFEAKVQKEIKKILEQEVAKKEGEAAVADLKKKIPYIYLDPPEKPSQESRRDRAGTPRGAR
jgi:hypothetical protein